MSTRRVKWTFREGDVVIGKSLGQGATCTIARLHVVRGRPGLPVGHYALRLDTDQAWDPLHLGREAEVMTRLRHLDCVPRVYGLARIPCGAVGLLMEEVKGFPLTQVVRGVVTAPPDLAQRVLAAAEAVNAAGYIHGDMHTDNLLLRPDGSVAMVDFATTVPTAEFLRPGDRSPPPPTLCLLIDLESFLDDLDYEGYDDADGCMAAVRDRKDHLAGAREALRIISAHDHASFERWKEVWGTN